MEVIKINIVHITFLRNNRASGVNSIVPYHIKYQSRYSNVFWYNISSKYRPSKEDVDFYHGIEDYPNYDIKSLDEPFSSPDLVIFHGVFFYQYLKIFRELIKRNIPYIVVPHGSLTKYALKKKYIKKLIGIKLLFSEFIGKAKAIQYLTEGEYKNSGDKWNTDYIIIPNGCDIPIKKKEHLNTVNLKGTFIGRKAIYYKGLDLLIEACSIIKDYLEKYNCVISIYGPSEEKANSKLSRLINKYKLEKFIHLKDGVYGQQKEDIILNSDFFIMTSRTEGHPVALIEALSYGVPCFVTQGTNMATEVNKFNAGWGVKNGVKSISNGLIKMLEEIDTFGEKSSNARLLSNKYEWDTLAKLSIEKYKELIRKD